MKTETGAAIRAIIATDSTISADAAKAALDALTKTHTTEDEDRVLSRAEVAALMGKSVKAIDIYGRRGVIRRVYLTGGGSQRIQAQGYSRNSVLAAIRKEKPEKDASK